MAKKKKHKKKGKKVNKSFYATSNISAQNRGIDYPEISGHNVRTERGAQVYSLSNIMGINGYGQHGAKINVPTDNPYFALSPEERNQIFQLSSPVFGIVSSRMNRIAGLEFEVIADCKIEDEKADQFKNAYNIIKEFEGLYDVQSMVTVAKLRQFLLSNLKTVRPDLANFNKALLRWKRGLSKTSQAKADNVKEWLMHPNPMETWIDFVKIWVYDLMMHGTSAIYKKVIDGTLNNIQHLAGGTTIPIRTPFVDSQEAYVQMLDYRYQVFFENELTFSQYIPVSWRSYGMIPIEALINKVAETLQFDKLMAEQADGTKPPEKAVMITEQKILGNDMDLRVPLQQGEQKRIEEKLNNPIKNGIMTFNGNNIEVVDLSKENTMEFQNTRQKDIREEVALVFNMSNMEVNLTGSEGTSGRSTSEVQQEIEQGKGIAPVLKTIEQKLNDEIIPYRAGTGYTMKFTVQDNEEKQVDLLTKKKNSGLWSINQLRIEDLNEMPFEGEEYDKPVGASVQDNSQINPFFTSNVE